MKNKCKIGFHWICKVTKKWEDCKYYEPENDGRCRWIRRGDIECICPSARKEALEEIVR